MDELLKETINGALEGIILTDEVKDTIVRSVAERLCEQGFISGTIERGRATQAAKDRRERLVAAALTGAVANNQISNPAEYAVTTADQVIRKIDGSAQEDIGDSIQEEKDDGLVEYFSFKPSGKFYTEGFDGLWSMVFSAVKEEVGP